MTPMTERVRIQNENAELNHYKGERQPLRMPHVLVSLLRFSRPKTERPAKAQPAAARHAGMTRGA
jgi:hypothetical protein